MHHPPPRDLLIPQARAILREAGWTERQVSVAVPDELRKPGESRSRWARPFIVAAAQVLVPKLGGRHAAVALATGSCATWKWAKLPHQDPPSTDSERLAKAPEPKPASKGIITSKLIELLEDGHSVRMIAAEFGTSPGVIYRRLRDLRSVAEYIGSASDVHGR
jgi:hypothetical protein